MFKLQNAELAQRLEELRGADITDLSDEIALSRVLTEVAVNRGQICLAGQLLNTCAKLELAAVAQKEKLHHLLDSSELYAAGEAISRALLENLSGFPNFPEICDAAIPAIKSAIATVREPLRITHEVAPCSEVAEREADPQHTT